MKRLMAYVEENNFIKLLKPITLQEFIQMNYKNYYFTFDKNIKNKDKLESVDSFYKLNDDDYYIISHNQLSKEGHSGLNKNDIVYIIKKENL